MLEDCFQVPTLDPVHGVVHNTRVPCCTRLSGGLHSDLFYFVALVNAAGRPFKYLGYVYGLN